jgi:membrane-associated phospholipid phosphatase
VIRLPAFRPRHVWIGAGLLLAVLVLFELDPWILHVVRDRVYQPHRLYWTVLHEMRHLAEPGPILAAALLAFLYEQVRGVNRGRGRRAALAVLIAATLASGANVLVKIGAGRMRPHESDRATVFTGPVGGLRDSDYWSFPSGHAAATFAVARALSGYYPWTAAVTYPLAAGCGLSRVASARHFFTDIVAGAILGVLVACWSLRRRHPARAEAWLGRFLR